MLPSSIDVLSYDNIVLRRWHVDPGGGACCETDTHLDIAISIWISSRPERTDFFFCEQAYS